jgi:hypothetical protein
VEIRKDVRYLTTDHGLHLALQVLPVPLAEDQVLALTTFRCPDKPDELGASISLPLEVDSPLNINNYLPSSQSVLTCFR